MTKKSEAKLKGHIGTTIQSKSLQDYAELCDIRTKLTMLTEKTPQKGEKITTNKNKKKTFIFLEEKSFESGYQGHVYMDPETDTIILVHEGSQNPFVSTENIDASKLQKCKIKQEINKEIVKDWVTDLIILMGGLPKQLEDAEYYLDKVRGKYSVKKFVKSDNLLAAL